ncbi:MAG TPA: site-2 protease family protein [Dehalococcoidia bacterium]|jgi:regulator of sigma E protease|nr:site-2 protease family protein [Dehalococcoidia bacterium]MDP7261887.1 site-2 protease family protein [Dehalococcoidia bacterium]MDP7485458.1 site-2 protease family protein [Dehalococcoidia bacterium]HJP28393.1 site-2 protease family protein [Dehalococcoidia bacterium]|tara:strand:+ start:5017 stop:6666 length:1650 start_codon:yes stop_codon:yes gene_type:complete
MPETVFFGVVTFLVVLGPLVILHELGHLWTARRFGVKTLEFGFGYPPRVGGIWSGATPVLIDAGTVFEIDRGSLVGKTATIRTLLDEQSRSVAVNVRKRAKGDDSEASEGGLIITGKIKSFEGDQLIVADMLWSFNWLPLGGFVRMVGEESSSAVGSLGSKPRWQRIVVMGTGAFVNAVIPFILLPLVLMIPTEKLVGDVTIVTVFPGSPADEAGIKPGDKIVKVDGRKIENISELQQAVTVKLGAKSTWELESGIPNIFARPAESQYQYTGAVEKVTLIPRWRPPSRQVLAEVSDPETEMSLARARVYDVSVGLNTLVMVVDEPTDTLYEISNEDAARLDPPAAMGDILRVVGTAQDGGKHISLADARLHDNGLGTKTRVQEGATGVQISTENSETVSKGLSPFEAFPLGWRHALDIVVLTRNALTTILIGSSNPQFEGPSTVGPIGIGQLTGEIAVADAGMGAKIITFATLAATLSLSLAILNILPIPALDGGRIFFVFVEIARRGRRISPEREGLVHLVGFALLIGLIAVISVQDVTRIIKGESFF